MKDTEAERLRNACELFRKTGADNSQYILVRMDDLEELLRAYERDKETARWLKSMCMEIFPEVKHGTEQSGRVPENDTAGEEARTEGYSEGS